MPPDNHYVRELAMHYAAKHGAGAQKVIERYASINRKAADDDAADMWERVIAELQRMSRSESPGAFLARPTA